MYIHCIFFRGLQDYPNLSHQLKVRSSLKPPSVSIISWKNSQTLSKLLCSKLCFITRKRQRLKSAKGRVPWSRAQRVPSAKLLVVPSHWSCMDRAYLSQKWCATVCTDNHSLPKSWCPEFYLRFRHKNIVGHLQGWPCPRPCKCLQHSSWYCLVQGPI